VTMDIRVVATEELGAVGAGIVAEALAAAPSPTPTLMPALGASALPVYAELARRRQDGRIDLAGLRLVQLDEYLDVGPADERSLIGWLERDVARPLGVPPERIVRLPGDAADPEAAARAYDEAVDAAGGIDVAVLGLGPNGHLGFNEPPSDAVAPTRRVRLTPESLAANARYWPGREVPAEALTAGMATILNARRILLVVSGEGKRGILRRMLTEAIGARLPASYLRNHPATTLLVDRAAWPPDLSLDPSRGAPSG
jgi:glucosamine-6-phosphate deaminase